MPKLIHQAVQHTSQNTKIVATVGPACSAYDKLLELAHVGVNIFRLNFSHGTHEEHLEVINHLVKINEEYGFHVGILADLQGPKLRVGKIKGGSMVIHPGDVLTFVNQECEGDMERIYMSYDKFPTDVQVGERVLVDDGKVELEVVETNKMDTVKLVVLHGEVLSSNKGVNLPDTDVSQPSLTKKDLIDLEFILTQPVNWIALSFVRRAKDVKELRARVEAKNHQAKIIAKIEKPSAVANIGKIIKASNGIMIARGDLGVEMPIEKLPGIQKDIIFRCIQRSRPVIVATQMMDSMITNPSPTRAEATDVANAVLDGADALMLSGETSVGKHPARVVQAMNKIIREAELNYKIGIRRPVPNAKSSTFLSDVICHNAAVTAEQLGAKALLGMTLSGYTAFKLSSYRPSVKIFIFSERPYMLSTLNLVWGVTCYYYDKFTTTDETIDDIIEIMKTNFHLSPDDIVVNTGTMPLPNKGMTNYLKVTEVV
jgi:pyruvate kinase